MVAEDGEPVGVATISLPETQRTALVELIRTYGRPHPTGTITIPEGCLDATVHFTSRTSRGNLREARVSAVAPAADTRCGLHD
jgi:hypothetical protein